jgi:hypothetical protein
LICKICGQDSQDTVQQVSVASFVLPRVDNNITRLVDVLNQHFVNISCICRGGQGHMHGRPTVEIQPKDSAEVDKVRRLLSKHGFSVSTKVTTDEDETITSCNIQLRKVGAPKNMEDLSHQPGKLISFA